MVPLEDADKILEQVKKNIDVGEECYQLSAVGDLSLFRNCQYLDTKYTFVFFGENDQLILISINHKYFSEEEVDYIINSVK